MNPIDTRQIVNWDQMKVHIQPNLCLECQLIPQQPYQCYRCQKLLCQLCFQDLKTKSRGPKLYCQKCKALNYFNPANNSIYQNYRDMVIGCVNRRYGCKVTLDYKKYQKHVEDCEFQRIPCASPGCFVTTLKRARADHLNVCEYVVESCQFCNKPYNRKSMHYHLDKCQQNRIQDDQHSNKSDDDLQNIKSELLQLRNKLDSAIHILEHQEEVHTISDIQIVELEKIVQRQTLEIQELKTLVLQTQKSQKQSIFGN